MSLYVRMSINISARSIASKGKSDGSQVKESTDSSTTLEDDDSKGKTIEMHEFFPWWNNFFS